MTQAERRTRLEQLFSILEALSRGGDGPTHVMYKSNLSWKNLDGFLTLLAEKGLITFDWRFGYGRMHRENVQITERGRELLATYKHLKMEIAPNDEMELVLPDSDWAGGIPK